ncbi:aldo/keto reductase [Nocardia mexicana]|uniref:Aryl-alcohol dehydrogenase-like predicted oxidoreductase n=1 Tax=Nocardia mexicana TaxID=279262 RepID=A0A370GHU1_9NOCA|nr:aldo/keto reductase [Nocardia mexicana]RDI42806.1 aryl-alcohol dehydrogenase-like predicted oxidoreductase [Nocardia mexicana]
MAKLGTTDLDVFPLCLGGNVFGWTADQAVSFAVLDAYAAAGGNFVDTADVYSAWVPGNSGGESETVLGQWLAARGNRDSVVIATKGSRLAPFEGLSAKAIHGAADASLRRLGTDYIDLYYAHYDDPDTPVAETVAAYDELVRAGKVRYVAVSNMSTDRIRESLAVADREGLARYVAIQPHYNLVERADFERDVLPLASAEGLATVPYYALAKGFLTGKYRPGVEVDSPRAQGAASYLDERGERVLGELDRIAAAHGVPIAAVSLAWLAAQPTVAAPIASARTPEQLADLLPVGELRLSDEELSALTAASD